jgi:hypothetical protein
MMTPVAMVAESTRLKFVNELPSEKTSSGRRRGIPPRRIDNGYCEFYLSPRAGLDQRGLVVTNLRVQTEEASNVSPAAVFQTRWRD